MTHRLVTFGISRYCEKARWALDWHGIPFDEVSWPPGLHARLAQKAGAARSSVPILFSGDTLVQGSSAIIDWADENAGKGASSLTPDSDPDAAHELEQRADAQIGVHVRRFIYAQVLPKNAHQVKPYLLMNTSPSHRLVGNLTWPAVRRLMIKVMDTTPEAVPDSSARLEAELAPLEARLAEATVYSAMTLTPAVERDLAEWTQRPIIRWVCDMYREYRGPS